MKTYAESTMQDAIMLIQICQDSMGGLMIISSMKLLHIAIPIYNTD